MVDAKVKVGMADLDLNIRSLVDDHIFAAVSDSPFSGVISDDDFKSLAISGLMSDIQSIVRKYYSDVADVDVVISPQDLLRRYRDIDK